MKLFNNKHPYRQQQGFTLVEVLIVIVVSSIIGVAVVGAIYQTIATYNRNTARTEANSQIGFATKYIHEDAQESKTVYIYDFNANKWVFVTAGSEQYNLLDCPFLLERPFWSMEDTGYLYEAYKYTLDPNTKELIRSHYYYNNINELTLYTEANSVIPVARFIDTSLTDSEGNAIKLNYWEVPMQSGYPNGIKFIAQITCTAGTAYPQTVSGTVDVIRMMNWN